MIFSIGSAQDSSFNYNLKDWNRINFKLQETNRDSLVQLQERVVLHIANDHAIKDNLIFFKGYLITGVHQNRYSPSHVLNIELLDVNGAIIKRQFHKITDGMVVGNLLLPENTKPGMYYVRSYTRWMQNYGEDFYTKRPIWIGGSSGETSDIGNKSDILIFPEGGTLLSGHENKVVVKMQHNMAAQEGKVGRILDDKNNEVAIVNKYSTCVGTFIYKPIKDREYRLELENGSIFPIPRALNQGYLLHVNNLDATIVKIRVTASLEVTEKAVKLVGIVGGIRYFEKQLDFRDSNFADVEFSNENIPNGILMVKLIDDRGFKLAKRPIWIDAERLHIDIDPIYSGTDESAYRIKVTDKTNSPIKTQLAISANRYEVFNEKVIEECSVNHTDLLICPEIAEGEKILSDRKERFLKDLNILVSDVGLGNTNLDGNNFESDIKFPIQKGLELIGYTYDLDNKLLTNTEIQIMAKSKDEIWFKETETDANGLLRMEELQVNGTTTLVIRTKGESIKSRLVKFQPLIQQYGEKDKPLAKVAKKQEMNRIYEPTSWQPIDTIGLIKLDGVEISENAIKERKSKPSIYGIDVPDHRVKYQDPTNPRSFGQMLSEIPGVSVSGIGDFNPSVRITRAVGGGPVLFVLDGMPLSQGSDGQGQMSGIKVANSLRPIMNMVSDIDVERVELMVGADASIYGTRGAGGVILVYTRSGEESEFIRRKDGQLVFQGYETVLEFESYQKGLSKREREKSNLLYWNSKLETDENGEAIIRFPASSQETKIKIQISIITPDGKIGSLAANY